MSTHPAKNAMEQPDDSAGVSGQAAARRLSAFHPKKNRDEHFFSKLRVAGECPATLPDSPPDEPPKPEGSRQAVIPLAIRSAFSNKRIVISAALVIAVSFLASGAAFLIGHARGKAAANREILGTRLRAMKPLSAEGAAALRQAMAELRDGQTASAFREISALRKQFPQASSLAYLSALAALQDGRFAEAEALVTESLKAGERISDCLALLSVLEQRKAAENPAAQPGSGTLRAEQLLRAAITADAANPNPHIELANLLRQNGRHAEALAELRAAQALFNPVDSHMVMDLTVALMDLEEAPDGKLPGDTPAPGDVRKLFPAAYAALRRDDSATAASLFGQCRDLLAPEIFHYMMDDPALQKFAGRPELKAFFEN